MGDVVNLECVTRLDLPPDRILASALGKLQSVLVIGYDTEGVEYFASSLADGAEALWLLERSKKKLLEIGDTDK